MKMIMKTLIAAALAAVNVSAADISEPIEKLNTFYFGNSYLGNSMPGFHPIMGKSAGKTWEVEALISPGIPICVHAIRQTDPKVADYKKFHDVGKDVDAIVMLRFGGMGMKYVVDQMYSGAYKFDPPKDVGDLASCITLVNEYLKMNLKGKAYVYTAWPSSPELGEFRKRVEEEVKKSVANPNMERGELMKLVKEGVDARDDDLESILENYNYEEDWLAKDYNPNSTSLEVRKRMVKYAGCVSKHAKDKDWKPTLEEFAQEAGVTSEQVKADLEANLLDIDKLRASADLKKLLSRGTGNWYRTHSRPHNYALLEGLKKEFPELWKEGRLGMIPVGDVMLALDKKIKAGAMPPLKSVGQLALGHMRSGLGRYMLGATFYAVLFKDNPSHLDASIYANRDNYINKTAKINIVQGFYCHAPDLGRHIEITPERKKVMDETIWEVVKGHPYTQVKQGK